jgi:hypothetical protein
MIEWYFLPEARLCIYRNISVVGSHVGIQYKVTIYLNMIYDPYLIRQRRTHQMLRQKKVLILAMQSAFRSGDLVISNGAD